MFGPEMEQLAGQNVIVCKAGCAIAEDAAAELFRHTSAHLTAMPLSEHDWLMTWVLNLPHLVNLVMGASLPASGLSYTHLRSLGGTTFRKQMKVTAQVMSENSELYYQIQHINRHRDRLYATVGASLELIASLAASQDSEGFAKMMKDSLGYTKENHE
jgi:chorismate mutase/prephenate dehydrogenase